MPITVRKFNAQVKDPNTGDMVPAGLLSSDALGAIESAKNDAVTAVEGKQAVAEAAVELKGQTTLASIPADYTELSNEVDDVRTHLEFLSAGEKNLPPSSIIQGSFNADGTISQAANRIRNTGFVTLKAGEKIHFSPGAVASEMLYAKYSVIGTYEGYTEWYSTASDIEFNVDKKLIFVFRNSTNSNITPEEYDATIKFYTSTEIRFEEIEEDISSLETSVNSLTSKTANIEAAVDKMNGEDYSLKPYIVETKARYCWPYYQEPSVFKSSDSRYTEDGNANNAYFKITGNEGDAYVTVITGGNASPSDIADYTMKWSAVISYDAVHYEPCLAWYIDSTTLGVWPALKDDISEGEIAAMWSDTMHLTRRGYIGFAQAVFNANPKYCEKKSYIDKWIAGDTVPFTAIGGTMYGASGSNFNYSEDGGYINGNQFENYSKTNTSSTETTGKRGVYWEITSDTPKSGYAEIMIGGAHLTDPDIPEGYEIYIDLYVNDVLEEQYTKTINVLEDICLNFENATKLKVEIYQNKQAATMLNGRGFRLSSIHFWENQRKNANSLFPKGAIVAQMFDSWGVFHDGASGKEFSRLINEKTGVTVPYTNHSLGGQTSAWGKAWFYNNLQQYHPAIGIVDFGINDANSIASSDVPNTILGPDGTSYDNKIDIEEYAVNMQIIADEAESNNIQVIMTANPLPIRGLWYYALTDNVN